MTFHVTNPHYAQIPLGAFSDTRISATAVRLLGAMYGYSFPVENSTDRKVSLARVTLMGCANIGKDTYYKAIKELVAAGWIREPKVLKGESTVFYLPAKDNAQTTYAPMETCKDVARVRKAVLDLGYDDEAVVYVTVGDYDNNTTFSVEGDTTKYNLDGEAMGRSKKQDKATSIEEHTRTEKQKTIEAPIEEVKEETKVVLKPKKRTLKRVVKPVSEKQDTPAVKEKTTRPKKQDKPVFERGYNIYTHTATQPKPSAPAPAPVEKKPTTFKRFDSGEECGPLHEEKPTQYKLMKKLDEHGNVVDSWIVDKVTLLEDGMTEEDHFFMKAL